MSTQPLISSSLAPTFICQICRRALVLPGTPIIGERPPEKHARITDMLWSHIQKDHQQQFQFIGMTANNFAGWMIWEQFKHADTELLAHHNEIRAGIRRATKRVHVRDEAIEAQIQTHFANIETMPTDEVRKLVIQLLKGLRDVLEEVQPH